MCDTSWIQINLNALRRNAQWWRQTLAGSGGARLCAVVKADAYGLGAPAVVDVLADHVDMFAVYSPRQAEAVLAVEACVQRPVLVFMPQSQWTWNTALRQAAGAGRLHVSIHSEQCLREAERVAATLRQALSVHLFVDTGMSRGGLAADQLPTMLTRAAGARQLRVAGIYTHFASADDDAAFLDQQLACLHQAAAGRPDGAWLHAANTCAAMRGQQYHLDMSRVGLGLYGYDPAALARPTMTGEQQLTPAVRWLSRLVHVGHWPKGAAVGYNSTHRLRRDSVLALVPAGYADGYPLSLSNRGVVMLPRNGRKPQCAKIVGKVNMDQIVIDVTGIDDVKAGDIAELISDDPSSPCALPRLAELAKTNCYEMLCRLSPRLRRAYVDVDSGG